MSGSALSYIYQPPLSAGTGMVVRSTDNAHIPCDLANRDYQDFLEYIAAGNTAPEGWTGPKNA